jgi:hypothetical protein
MEYRVFYLDHEGVSQRADFSTKTGAMRFFHRVNSGNKTIWRIKGRECIGLADAEGRVRVGHATLARLRSRG